MAELRADYDRLKQQLLELDFICQGTLTTRHERCGHRNCRCRADPPQLHGPYHLLTRKLQGKTSTLRIPADLLPLYQRYVSNRQRLQAILDRMLETSDIALKAELADNRTS